METQYKIAVVGLGLMGQSITSCILPSSSEVIAFDKNAIQNSIALNNIKNNLREQKNEGIIDEDPHSLLSKLTISHTIEKIRKCDIIIETISENIDQKIALLLQLENIVDSGALICSNTSAIPVSLLQKDMQFPERVFGLHWAEPAHITRFMEIICGDKSDSTHLSTLLNLAKKWEKEPSVLHKDIRGFIANRIMYAMLREAFFLVENGYATFESVDRSLRNDVGYWISFAGPFRFMDLTGIPAYLAVMKDLFPELNNSTKPPALMEKIVSEGALGIKNGKGFYTYSRESSQKWEELFTSFTYDIRKLTHKYSTEKIKQSSEKY